MTYLILLFRSHFGSSPLVSRLDIFAFALRLYDGFVRRLARWRILIYISAAVKVVLAMPHSHSIGKLRLRTQRALALGYAPSVAGGKCTISCSKSIEAAAVACVRSLDLHYQHDSVLPLGMPAHHHGRLATREALLQGCIDKKAADAATAQHRTAGRKKHQIGTLAKLSHSRRVVPVPVGSTGLWEELLDDGEFLENDLSLKWPVVPLSPAVADVRENDSEVNMLPGRRQIHRVFELDCAMFFCRCLRLRLLL